jgi:predicted  nucleic acid-binding Zn-ribbon protein
MADFLEKLEKINQHVSQLKDRITKLESENEDLKKAIASKEKNDEFAIKKLEELLEKVKDL